jgi:hypothetical protein
MALKKIHGQSQTLGMVVRQSLQQAEGKGLHVGMIVLLSKRHNISLRHRLHECVEGNRPLGLEIDQSTLEVWEQNWQVCSASCPEVILGTLAVLALDSSRQRPAPGGWESQHSTGRKKQGHEAEEASVHTASSL